MLDGQPTVFLACSDQFKAQVAIPVREALAACGVRGIIVSEEPLLPWTPSDPDSKVNSYLDASDAFVALCTPDNRLDDGIVECRQNVVLEIQRAFDRPGLSRRVQVVKAPDVTLPSDINPTYDRLDIDNPGPAVDAIVNQLRAWRVLASAPNAAPAAAEDPATVDDLIQGLGLGDYDNATLRAYALMRVESRESQKTVVARLVRFLRGSQPDNKDTLIAGSVLESISQLDPSLVPIEAIEELAGSADYSTRSIAATLLWDRAKVAPADVPLGLLGRLALPAREDWYVQAPAMAAAKQLLLHRRAARIVFDVLAASDDSDDRHAVASALLDVARVDPTAVPSDLADRLARDEERLVMMKATEVLAVLRDADDEQKDSRSPFGL